MIVLISIVTSLIIYGGVVLWYADYLHEKSMYKIDLQVLARRALFWPLDMIARAVKSRF